MDWVRFNRALHAKSIIDTEQVARQHNKGNIKAKDIDRQTHERIKKNELLYQNWLKQFETGDE